MKRPSRVVGWRRFDGEALDHLALGQNLELLHTLVGPPSGTAGTPFGRELVALLEFATQYPQCEGLLVASVDDLCPGRPDVASWVAGRIRRAGRAVYCGESVATQRPADASRREDAELRSQFEAAHRHFVGHADFEAAAAPRVLTLTIFQNRCFAKCRFCPQVQHPESVVFEDMDDSLFRKIIGDIPVDLPIVVRFGTGGEPLAYPRIHGLVRYVAQTRPLARTEYATNGILLNDADVRRILSSGLTDLTVSLNAPTREDYRWFTGIDAYDRVIANMRRLIESRRRAGSALPSITTKLMTLGRWAGRVDEALSRLRDVADRAVPSHVYFYDRDELENIDAFKGPNLPFIQTCSYLSYVMIVMPGGDFQVCCAPDFTFEAGPPLGNARRDHFLDVWRSPAYRCLRLKNARGEAVMQSCDSCNVDRPDLVTDLLIKARQRTLLDSWSISETSFPRPRTV